MKNTFFEYSVKIQRHVITTSEKTKLYALYPSIMKNKNSLDKV